MDAGTTEEQNKALLRRLYEEALQQGNLALIDQLFSPAFIDHSTPDQPPGPAGVKAYFREIRNAFPDIQVTLDDLIAEGDRVVARTTWRGTHLGAYEGVPASGRSVTRTLIQIFLIANKVIMEEWNEGAGLLKN
jgi:steroid delta-isomerase-like uncharacterized protein